MAISVLGCEESGPEAGAGSDEAACSVMELSRGKSTVLHGAGLSSRLGPDESWEASQDGLPSW